VVGDEVAGVAVEDLNGVSWGFTDMHDVLLPTDIPCAYATTGNGDTRR
jgi:hypothetical protein